MSVIGNNHLSNFFMVSEKEKIAVELTKARIIWKDLVNNHKPVEIKISEIFTRYKTFLEENKNLIRKEGAFRQEVEIIEKKLSYYEELSDNREKRILLNEAYLGLVFDVSESIDELKNKMEEEAYSASEQAFLN